MIRLAALAATALALVASAFALPLLEGEPTLPETPYTYADIPLPAHLRVGPIAAADNTPADNPITDAGATLGRVLFYDTRLSRNLTVSCASCHLQANGFSDPQALSTGFEGGQTARHSMGLSFARFYQNGRFFWDERAATLEEQTLLPIQDHVEMGMTLPEVVTRLEATPFYGDLFRDAFGDDAVTPDRMALALGQFVRSIVAPDSPYDRGRSAQGGPPGRPVPGLSAQENQGLQLFFGRAGCDRCHAGDLFLTDRPFNNGLDATVTDEGAGGGRFKSPSLRNIELTAPYMHDGRFATLEAVVEHYDSGVQNNPNLAGQLRQRNGQPQRLGLSAAERAALVAFLRTLTDRAVTTDPRWSDPFNVTTPVETVEPAASLQAGPAYPNPFTAQTTVPFSLPAAAEVTVTVYDAAGRQVAARQEGLLDAGAHETVLALESLPAGRYVVRVEAGGQTATRLVTKAR